MCSLLYAALVFQVARCTDMSLFETRAHDPGETLTLTCPRSVKTTGSPTFHWIRVVSGSYPEFLGGTYSFEYEGVNKTPHTTTKQGDGTFDLIIHQLSLTDTGFYYCVKEQELKMELVFGIFLIIKDPASIVRVESPDLSGPVDSGDSVDLQCWVQMENAQCFEEHMVWWFRSGLDQSGPGLVYTQRNSSAQCDRSTEDPGPHKCLYTFSKTMSPSDAGTYRCAVAACGHILFGNGTEVTVKEETLSLENTILILLSVALTISITVILVLIYFIKKRTGHCFHVGQNHIDERARDEHTRQLGDAEVMYSAPKYKSKADRSQRRAVKTEEQVLYSDVRVKH
ncbi:uncharacterized protein LOC129456556 isoform X2 [Periophthalmus magnuspinnatus]|uniref:uncharacterized protein LOC129456556 isoform X2 n=1 Tax=Periophthalmus magnuspinnatus TaxID=409849 RepID=UPI002436CB2E|nr:uncharacterized protein LOC129456556 isoform X2 [Periophthalmus magnuspinnatus]